MASKKTIIRGATWKPRLFIDTAGKMTLLEYPAVATGNGKDLSAGSCEIGAKKTAAARIYSMDPIAGDCGADGYLDFTISDIQSALLSVGAHLVEILWISSTGEYFRFQILLTVTGQVIDDSITPAINITNFAGHNPGLTITIPDQGNAAYFVNVVAIGDHGGNIGDVSVTITSSTQFIVKNWGSSRGQFTWRLFR